MENWQSLSLLGYPVAEEQLKVLNLLGLKGMVWLWIVRGISLIILVATVKLWSKVISRNNHQNIANLSAILIIVSPLFLVLWMVYPLICLKLLIFVMITGLGIKNKYIFLILSIFLILFNRQILGDKAAIFYKLNLKDAQTEVTKRISTEDSLVESVSMPIWWRRVSYNKYFFSYKQILAETLPFFDLESIFFQEINPLAQKSIVIFFWPEVYLFVLGLYFLVNLKDKKLYSLLLVSLSLAWVDFVFSEGAVFKRLVLIIMPVSVIIALGLYNLYLLAKQKKILAKLSLGLVVVFIIFGWINSIYDLNTRRDLWLDNRPLAFEFWYRGLQNIGDINRYKKIYITSLVGDSKSFCYFYLGKMCRSDKFVFESFDLSSKREEKPVLYAGFAGEFVGSRFKNDISSDWIDQAKDMSINIRETKSLRDTIANRYGNDIGIGVVQ